MRLRSLLPAAFLSPALLPYRGFGVHSCWGICFSQFVGRSEEGRHSLRNHTRHQWPLSGYWRIYPYPPPDRRMQRLNASPVSERLSTKRVWFRAKAERQRRSAWQSVIACAAFSRLTGMGHSPDSSIICRTGNSSVAVSMILRLCPTERASCTGGSRSG